jgi:hypothetical protein
MMLILIISCYTFINTSLKISISSFVANPAIVLSGLILIIATSFYNINIAILMLLALFIALYGSTLFTSSITSTKLSNNNIEGFTDETEDTEDPDNVDEVDEDEEKPMKKISDKEFREYAEKESEKKIERYKDIIMSPIKNIINASDKQEKEDLLEEKKKMFTNLKKNNKNEKSNNKSTNKSNNKTNKSKDRKRENFQTIKPRKFDPTNEEDTNLLITKEILNDMNNRIEYNYETNEYLKKYLKHRIEEMVNINKLLDNDDDE